MNRIRLIAAAAIAALALAACSSTPQEPRILWRHLGPGTVTYQGRQAPVTDAIQTGNSRTGWDQVVTVDWPDGEYGTFPLSAYHHGGQS